MQAVSSAGIADYEFCADLDYPRENAFEKGSFVLSSLLFAKEKPALILPAVKQLFEAGVSALAYKTVIFQDLPEEVISFSNENDFPIFRFGTDVYFENIIFEITDAIRLDDTNLLTEINIKRMIDNDFSKSQVYFFSKNISLSFKEYSMGVYIKSSADSFRLNLDRYYKNFYLNRNFSSYSAIGIYQYLIPLQNEQIMQSYMDSLIKPLLSKPEYFETVKQLVLHGGYAFQTADCFDCHQNTIRYR